MMISERETLFALLSAGGGWDECHLDGLDVRPGGRVELAAVPAVRPPRLGEPAAAAPSGLALDSSCGLYVSDASGRRVIRVSLDCGGRLVLSADDAPGPPLLVAPAGLCIGPFGWLFVADPGRGEVLVFHAEQLSLRDVWSEGLARPVAVAADGERGLFVLDEGVGRVLRFDPRGSADNAFARRMSSPTGPAQPLAIASGGDGKLYVGDAASRSVLVFNGDGSAGGPPLAVGTVAQALAVSGERLFVGDRTGGEIRMFSLGDGRALGAVAGYRGPVSAIAAQRNGRLYIKPGSDASYLVAGPDAGRLNRGTLEAGPLDAGEDSRWLRLAVEAEIPPGTEMLVETRTAPDAAAPPAWRPAASPDLLLDGERFLWIRITLERLGQTGTSSPVLVEARAQTEGETYLDHLPLVYSRAGSDFLRRLLALAQSELGDLEAVIEQLPRGVGVDTAPAATLPVLAGWQAFEVPSRLARSDDASELRTLLAELPELHRIRGTPHGVARFVEIYTGVRPLLFETFRTRGAWMLDGTSALGFGTALPASAPDGIILGASVVGASAPEDPDTFARTVFDDTAHRFTVGAPAGCLGHGERRLVSEVLDSEKPVHTQYHLCFWESRFRVGLQAHVGVDAIVAGPPEGLVMDRHARLGLDARIADQPTGAPGAIGRHARLGVDTVVG